ncbi:MAG TPA: hypothetical protein VOA64_08235 [Candidatus Dormibacteraeota bacterium]|nr:hypothetical protein [Candidatus Dormibacteraeota bacterium]
MKVGDCVRRLIVFVVLAIAVVVAVAQPVLGFVFAFLIPIWLFFAAVVSAPIPRPRETFRALAFPCLPIFSPRPPPIQ